MAITILTKRVGDFDLRTYPDVSPRRTRSVFGRIYPRQIDFSHDFSNALGEQSTHAAFGSDFENSIGELPDFTRWSPPYHRFDEDGIYTTNTASVDRGAFKCGYRFVHVELMFRLDAPVTRGVLAQDKQTDLGLPGGRLVIESVDTSTARLQWEEILTPSGTPVVYPFDSVPWQLFRAGRASSSSLPLAMPSGAG